MKPYYCNQDSLIAAAAAIIQGQQQLTDDFVTLDKELVEGFFSNMLKKAALAMASPKTLADSWYQGAESHMKKMNSSLSHDNVEKFAAASIALKRVRDEAAAMKSSGDAIAFLGNAEKIKTLIKKHTEEILKKGLFL